LLMVDGKPVCQQTPCSKLLATGNYTVSMLKERYLEKSDDVTVKKGMGPVNFTLAPDFGWLTVKSNPPGLDVKINGKIEGKTPIIRKEMSKGGYEVMVSDPGYYDQGKQVMIERGEEKVVDVTLIAKEGGLKVKAFDKDGNALSGEIFINGQKAGEIPYAGKVKVGSHEVEGRTKKGSFKKIASVKENEITEVSEVVKGGAVGDMVYIQGGEFWMGCVPNDSTCQEDEKPRHKVTLSGYYIGKTEVTVGQFRQFVDDSGYKTEAEKGDGCWSQDDSGWGYKKWANWKNPGFSQVENHPVVCVSWNDAQEYIKWLSKKTGENYRLPTEAEWEYAAKNQGKDVIYPWGNAKATCNYAVMDDGGYGCGKARTWEVCSKPKGNTEQGLCDMSGNVWEWVEDWYDKSYYGKSPSSNPKGPSSGTSRVLRGGSWNVNSDFLRASIRYWLGPDYWFIN
ncbi:MAG: SUMF1/EgtB/PvdO family nonheme iron enzyme, partial [Deltaproteobacteria bacterium]|nr:SUMF1/EgtB/PvdO family nonheme iron enzyme [Deltaproteobacteria bacterium]